MKKKAQNKCSKTPDLCLLIVYLCCTLYFLFEAIVGALIPFKYILIGALLLASIFGLFYLSVHFSKQGNWLRRGAIAVLSGLLLIASLFQGNIRNAFSKVDDGSENVQGISVVVLNDSPYQEIDELANQSVAMIRDKELDLVQFAQQQMASIPLSYLEVNDAITLGNELLNKNVEAILLSDSTLAIMQTNNDEFKNNFRVLKTFEKRNANTEVGSSKDISKEPFTVYISGLDSLGIPNYNGLSDVNMLLMVDPVAHHIEMVSIPRDSYIPNLAANSYPDKLTHTGNSGIDNTVQSMEKVFGFDIDYYAKVSFSSLIEIINTLGGIEVDVQIEFYEQDENRDFSNQIHLYPGVQTLNGREALAYARHRHTEGWGDIGRTHAQQQIIEGIINKMLTSEGITKVPDVLNVGAEYVSTNMPTSTIKNFVNNEIANIRPWTFSSTSLENGLNSQQLCVTALEYGGLFVYFLSMDDLADVYSKYLAMHEPVSFEQFNFDLNDLSKGKIYPPLNPYLLTSTNYVENMPIKFPDLVYVPPVYVEEPTDEEVPPVEEEPSDNPNEDVEGELPPITPDGDQSEETPVDPTIPVESPNTDEIIPESPVGAE